MTAETVAPTLLDTWRKNNPQTPIIDDVHEAVVTNPEIQTVDDAVRAFFTSTPDWLRQTMRVRNWIVGRLGFAAGDATEPVIPEVIEVGQAFSVFGVLDRTDDEILLGGDDDHFSMRISMHLVDHLGVPLVRLATIAHHHDVMGQVYLSFVKYPHGPIARMCTNRLAAEPA